MPGHPRPPNVVVFFTDQQRWDTTGVHGNPLELTPNFDRIAQAHTHVYHSFTCQPVCAPARACLQSGQYPSQVGTYRNNAPFPENIPTLAHSFREAGYKTGYIGKWHLGGPDEQPDGKRESYTPEHKRAGYEFWRGSNTLEFTSDSFHTKVYDENNQPVHLPGHRVDALTDSAIRFVDDHKEEPFFLFLSHLEPHHQNHLDDYPAPHGYRERYAGRWTPPDLEALGGSTFAHLGGYFGMVKRLDEAFGRLMDALHSLGLDDNTIVLFTSDHACHFKTRNAEYKRSCHESSIRVPTLFHGPGFKGGGQLQQLVSLIDLPPTLLEAAGLPIPDSFQGRSLMPLLQRSSSDWRDEVYIEISETQTGRALRTTRWKYSVAAPEHRDEPFSLSYQEEFLYDLLADPHELNNLIGYASFRPIADTLRERLIQRIVEAGNPKPTISPAPITVQGQSRRPNLDL